MRRSASSDVGGREVAVESEMKPPLAVGVQFVAHDGGPKPRTAAATESGLKRMPVGLASTREFRPGEPGGDVRGEARTERERVVFVAETHAEGRGFDFGAEFHTAKIENSYLCGYDSASELQNKSGPRRAPPGGRISRPGDGDVSPCGDSSTRWEVLRTGGAGAGAPHGGGSPWTAPRRRISA